MTVLDTRQALEVVRTSIRACTRCPVRNEAREPVPCDVGFNIPDHAMTGRILIVGRNPGRDEDQRGRPFVGRAGRLLDEWLVHAGLNREQVIVTNLLKCYTLANREPKPEEVDVCKAWLRLELRLLQPSIVIALGRQASDALTGGSVDYSEARGQVYAPPLPGQPSLFVTFHPSAALRNITFRNTFFRHASVLRRWVTDMEAQGRPILTA